MTNAIEIRGLRKTLGDFTLGDIDMDVPEGCIVGLIGENGAGKTTLMKCLTGVNRFESGTVRILGSDIGECDKGAIGVVFDECHFFQQMDGTRLGTLMSSLFPSWDDSRYREMMGRFGIPMGKKVSEYSRGMRMKVQVAVAMSHDPRLLFLDEATAGMDPAARDEFLDVVMDFIQREDRTVVMSSHITSDLERIADYIVFIHDGRIVMNGVKDDILENYGIVKGNESAVRAIGDENIMSIRMGSTHTSALVSDRRGIAEAYPELVVDPASLDDIMVMIIRGDAG